MAVAGIHMGVKAEEDENRVIADRVYIGDVSVAGMTEEEAHRYLQKRSMDNGTNMVETSYMVLQVFDLK